MQTTNLLSDFVALTTKASINNVYAKAITKACQMFDLKQHRIEDLTPETATQIYRNLILRNYNSKEIHMNTPWFENQRRIFLWLLFVYWHVQRLELQQMTSEDWEIFERIFYKRDPILLRFQAKLIVPKFEKSSRHDKWSEYECEILRNIVQDQNDGFRWIDVAKELFKKSNEGCFRTPKQCREQWKNHLDPRRSHDKWTAEEDRIIFQEVSSRGKKWAAIGKILNERRTEHMIKNRFNAIMKLWRKQLPNVQDKDLLRNYEKNLELMPNLPKQKQIRADENSQRTSIVHELQSTEHEARKTQDFLPCVSETPLSPAFEAEEMKMNDDSFIQHFDAKNVDPIDHFFADFDSVLDFGSSVHFF